ncbi:MAG: type II secretion system F family protein [Methylococcales bacterium]|nr:type II secretion system F family protein [Methylococcales bacterium]
MAQFSYTGRDSNGERVNGVLNSDDRHALAKQLMSSGITPLDIAPIHARETTISLSSNVFAERVAVLDVMMFNRQMYSLLKAGIPIMDALKGLQNFTQNKALAAVIADLCDSLDSGRELSSALQLHPKVFSHFYVSMIRVGEKTGLLDKVFLHLFDHLEFEKLMHDQVKAALRYPTFVIIAIAVAMVIINLFVIPAFVKMFQGFGAELPFMTKVLLNSSHFMIVAWPYLLIAGVGAVLLFRYAISTIKGKYQWDRVKLKIPIAGNIIYKSTMARFARSFALSTKSGISIINTLSLVEQTVDNDFIADKIQAMQSGLERGESILYSATQSGVFNLLVLQMIGVGEESGSLDELMAEVADMYQRDVEYEIKTLNAQVEPILIVCLGAMVLVLALGIFLPMWDFGRLAIHKN